MNASVDTRALPPRPLVPHAADGGLGYDDVQRDPQHAIPVLFGPYASLRAQDTVQVLWGENRDIVATHVIASDDEAGSIVTIAVPTRELLRFGNGHHPVACRVIGTLLPAPIDSAVQMVEIKTTVPGGIDRTPGTNENENLAAPLVSPDPLPADARGVQVTVPLYENHAEGDRVTISWNGRFIAAPPRSPDDPDRLVISIDEAIVRESGAGLTHVTYLVRDRVGNASGWAPGIDIDVPPDDAGAPPAPWVEGTVDDGGMIIDLAQWGSGDVSVRAEGHDGRTGDTLTLHWLGRTAQGRSVTFDSEPVKLARPSQTVDFAVPHDRLEPLAQGSAIVTYTLTTPQGTRVSQRRSLAVRGQVRTLPAPTVREAVSGVLDLTAAKHGATVIVVAWPGAAADDLCRLEWIGRQADGETTYYGASASGASLEGERVLLFTVPRHDVARLDGGSVLVRYLLEFSAPVTRAGDTQSEPLLQAVSPWLELTVRNESVPALTIDDSPLLLEGQLIRTQRRVTSPPSGTSAQRQASGGVPPYRYTVEGRAVEVDETTGHVVSFANGQAIVTVTDSQGQQASYPVQVNNVSHLFGTGIWGHFGSVAQKASQEGGHVPSLAEWEAFRTAYGGQPQLDDAIAWTTDATGLKQRYVIRPNSGQRETRTAAGLFQDSATGWGVKPHNA